MRRKPFLKRVEDAFNDIPAERKRVEKYHKEHKHESSFKSVKEEKHKGEKKNRFGWL